MADKKQFYAYPCNDFTDCLDFLEGYEKLTFREFCEKHCAHCPDCVELDIPYDEIKGAI